MQWVVRLSSEVCSFVEDSFQDENLLDYYAFNNDTRCADSALEDTFSESELLKEILEISN